MKTTHRTDVPQASIWKGSAGRAWVDSQALLDQMFKPFETLLVDAVPAGSEDRVLDVGCGTGSTTFAIARRLGSAGRCVGVDISDPMIAAARDRAAREDTPAGFVLADAQAHAFESASFDKVVSRFGVMFFDDAVGAFANLRRAAKDSASLRFIAWRSAAENPFMTTAERAAAPLLPGLPERQPDAPGQFAFADRGRVTHILQESGWSDIVIRPADVVCTFPERKLVAYLSRMGPVGSRLEDADERTRQLVVDTVRAAFSPFVQGAEVRFMAACWVVDANASPASSA